LSRFKIIVQYDGSCFSGWQLQKDKKTVQGEIENALKVISGIKNRVSVYGSGRTDAGVHAHGQVAHFDINTRLSNNELRNAINSNTSKDCKIMSVVEVNKNFEARFNATKRFYRYQVYLGSSILYKNQAWLTDNVDLELLNSLSGIVLGEHDFLSFSKFNPEKKNTRCVIYHSIWEKHNNMLIYNISGNRFLHHMVRYIVGTMIQISRNRFTIDEFKKLLGQPRKNVQIHRAPACGLILMKVEYGS